MIYCKQGIESGTRKSEKRIVNDQNIQPEESRKSEEKSRKSSVNGEKIKHEVSMDPRPDHSMESSNKDKVILDLVLINNDDLEYYLIEILW